MPAPGDNMSAGGGITKRGRPTVRRAHLFTKDCEHHSLQIAVSNVIVKSMMYAFGDEDPTSDSVQVMEDILTDFITEFCHEAARAAGSRQKVRIDDFKFVLRHDAKKLGRVEELLSLQKEIAKAKKLFDEEDK